MTLSELSVSYQNSAAAIHGRIAELRAKERHLTDPEAAFRIHQRINELTPLLREARELASLTAHYYDRSYYRYEQYTL